RTAFQEPRPDNDRRPLRAGEEFGPANHSEELDPIGPESEGLGVPSPRLDLAAPGHIQAFATRQIREGVQQHGQAFPSEEAAGEEDGAFVVRSLRRWRSVIEGESVWDR